MIEWSNHVDEDETDSGTISGKGVYKESKEKLICSRCHLGGHAYKSCNLSQLINAHRSGFVRDEQLAIVKAGNSQKEVPTLAPRHAGRIIAKLEKVCLIKPLTKLPPGYTNGNVLIVTNQFSCHSLEIQLGDKVSFDLGKKDLNKPVGFKPEVVHYFTRTFGEVSTYLSRCIESLENNKMQTAIALLSASNIATWHFLVNLEISAGDNAQIVYKLFRCLILITTHAENSRYEKSVKEVLCHIIEGSTFLKFIEGEIDCDKKNIVISFCQIVSKLQPSHSFSIYPLLQKLTQQSVGNTDVEFLLSIISNTFDSQKKSVIKKGTLLSSTEISNIPLDRSSNLVSVNADKPYNSYHEYGEIYYRLLRAEAFSAIQDGVRKLKNQTLDQRDMSIYLDVALADVQVSGKALSFGIKFKLKKKDFRPRSSSHLMYGNLLCLSPRCNFSDPIWAVVCDKDTDTDTANKDEIVVYIEFLEDNYLPLGQILADLITYSGKTVMVESPTYYEAIRSSLTIFRSINLGKYVIGRDIVFGKVFNYFDQTPEYLKDLPSPDMNDVLDDSQEEAFNACLKNKIGIIQGPPGTGKTYVGFHLAKHILSFNIEGPILLLSYKNHALDEFLLKILEICEERDVVRIGGQSKESQLERILLRNQIRQWSCLNTEVLESYCTRLKEAITKYASSAIFGNAQLSPRAKGRQQSRKKLTVTLLEQWGPPQDCLNQFKSIEKASLPISVKENYINDEEEDEEEKPEEDEDLVADMENERLVNVLKRTNKRKNTGTYFNFESLPKQGYRLADLPESCAFNESLLSTENLWNLNFSERIQFIYTSLRKTKDEFEDNVLQLQSSIKDELGKSLDQDILQKVEKLKSMKVIGATITGAAIHHDLLNAVRPRVIIVEEAAEILEPSLVAAINPEVEHLILIGDHKQLRPTVNSYKLVKKHRFDISMMERLMNIGYPYSVLKQQGRMRTEFADLLTDIYPDYRSFEDINDSRPPFPHFSKTMYFWSHSHPETRDRSYKNEGEANMVLSIARFLVRSGIKPANITVLAAYVNQLRILKKSYASGAARSNQKAGNYGEITFSTIDRYQGDENDFVIISLVRSNKENHIGFLKDRNRRCVAQSRARRGMYFVGNVACFKQHGTWSSFIRAMEQQGCVGHGITVKCDIEQHSQISTVFTSDELDKITKNPKLICSKQCTFRYNECGHSCFKTCKPFHEHHKCFLLVEYVCEANHTSQVKCHTKEANTSECRYPCERDMECTARHPCKEKCGVPHSHSWCSEEVHYTFPTCRHRSTDTKLCSAPITVKCRTRVEFQASCGHFLTTECYNSESSRNNVICTYPCNKSLVCTHPCPGNCSEPCPQRCAVCKKKKEDRAEEFRKQIQLKIDALKQTDFAFTLKILENNLPEYQSIEDRVMKFIQPKHNWYPKVTSIEAVSAPTLENKYLQACLGGHGCFTDLKFHGTSTGAILGILKEGFRLPSNPGMYGKGIYLATDSSKSAQEIYTKGSNKLLLCQVFLGKSYTFLNATERKKFLEQEKSSIYGSYGKQFLEQEMCDSIYAPRNSEVYNDEFVVFNPDQVYPKYIISYTVGEVPRHRPKLPPSTNCFKKHSFTFTRKVDTSDPFYVEASVAISHYIRTNRDEKTNAFDTNKVDIVLNYILEDKFNAMKAELQKKGYGDEILAFHATALANIDSILQYNLDPKRTPVHGRRHGDGCYFSEFPDFSAKYGNSLILFRVLPGREYTGEGFLPQKGYDSKKVKGDNLGYGEQLIIQNASQFLPAYVFYKKQ